MQWSLIIFVFFFSMSSQCFSQNADTLNKKVGYLKDIGLMSKEEGQIIQSQIQGNIIRSDRDLISSWYINWQKEEDAYGVGLLLQAKILRFSPQGGLERVNNTKDQKDFFVGGELIHIDPDFDLKRAEYLLSIDSPQKIITALREMNMLSVNQLELLNNEIDEMNIASQRQVLQFLIDMYSSEKKE